MKKYGEDNGPPWRKQPPAIAPPHPPLLSPPPPPPPSPPPPSPLGDFLGQFDATAKKAIAYNFFYITEARR